MDLVRHLRFFITVAHTAHFGRAAEQLAMTQPPLSQGIKRLEAHVGALLFARTTRGVHLTEVGTELLSAAKAVIASADRFAAAAATAATAQRSSLSAGVIESLPEDALAALAALPLVSATGGTTRELLNSVSRGDIALAVIEHPAPLPDLHGGDVVRIPTVIASRARVSSLRALDGHTLVVRRRADSPAAHDLALDTLRAKAWNGPIHEVRGHRDLIMRLLDGESWALTPVSVALPPGLLASAVRGLPPLRVRTVWRADAPQAVAALGTTITTSLTDWLDHVGT